MSKLHGPVILSICLAWSATSLALNLPVRNAPGAGATSAKKVDLSYFDSMEWDIVYSCASKDSFLYAAMFYGVVVLDIRNPASPQIVARVPFKGPPTSIVIEGTFAYVSCALEGIYIIDISDPLHPEVIRHEDTPGIARELMIQPPYLYLADDFAGLRILDVTVPQAPVFVDSLAFPLLNRVRGIDIRGPYVYLAASQSVHVVDVADPTQPFFAGEYASSDVAWDVAVDGNYMYVANGYQAMPIVSIVDSDSLVEVAHIDTYGYARRIAASGAYVYVADETGGLKIFDKTDPLTPVAAGLGSAYAIDVSLNGDRAYTSGAEQGAALFDISDPTAPVVLGKYESDEGAIRVEVRGNLLFTVGTSAQLSTFDISDPHHPVLLGRLEGHGGLEDVRMDIEGDVAALCAYFGVLRFIDISNPAQPFHAWYWYPETDGGYFVDVDLVGDTAYVADQWSISALDISNPSAPQVVGSGGGAFWCCIEDLEVYGKYAYVPAGEEGINILDLSTPGPLAWYQWVGNLNSTGSADGIAIDWPIAYILDSDEGLLVYDIERLDSMFLLGALSLPWHPESFRVVGSYAYLVHHDSDLLVVDVSDPFQPELAGSFQSIGPARDANVTGNVLYLADQYALGILDVSEVTSVSQPPPTLPHDCRILNAYPNPFNASIQVSYATDRAEWITLSVYNSLGQHVRRLVDQELGPGEHLLTWDGRGDRGDNVGTGVYLFVLQSHRDTDVRKVLLLK